MSLKKQLGLAMVTTALGATLVAGGSFALFTSSAQNTGNTFASGTVKVSLDKPEGTKYFDISNIAPGDNGSTQLTVTNGGSLELRYDLAQNLTGDLAWGTDGVKITIKDSAGNVIVPGDNNRVLAPAASEVLTVKWELPLAADDRYQNKTAQLGLTVNAEQTKNNQ
ncbi:TasA family protein [Paenibacillus swuensis]|uniref:TasA family protein n=1 Tax=Paenibacillus swuensis TaxID=1178515 RepID=UPI00083849EE|nr:TasA family protein [Paenibacillus swuensis]